jgi:uncharacterized protein (DUF1697 family)
MGIAGAETFIASGNVFFTSRATPATLQARIEKGLRARLGYDVATFLRTDTELAAIAQHRPFAASELEAANTFVVGFVAEPLTASATRTLLALRNDDDDFHVHRREIYWMSRRKQSDSTFSNAVLERALGTRTTFRGMNTIVRLVDRLGSR